MEHNTHKLDVHWDNLKRAAVAASVNRAGTINALKDCERALWRIAERLSVSDDYERCEIKASRGPIVEFTGRLLGRATCELQPPAKLDVEFLLYETKGGAYVAVCISRPAGQLEDAFIKATVIEPAADHQHMRLAVMDAFEWNESARKMVEALGWSSRRDID